MQATAPHPYSTGAQSARASTPSEFIASRGYDYLFFILSPVLALLVAELIDGLDWPFEPTEFLGGTQTRITFFIAIWTYAHVFAVVFRSYGNPVVFGHYRRRLLVFPPVAMASLMVSDWLFTATIVLISVWDWALADGRGKQPVDGAGVSPSS